MYIAMFIIVGILIFPIITSLYFFVDFDSKKLFFAIFIFGKFKVLSGYAKLRDYNTIYLHLSDNRAIILNLSALKKFSGSSNINKAFNIDLISIYLDCGLYNAISTFVFIETYNLISLFMPLFNLINNFNFNLNLINSYKSLISIKCKLRLQFNLISIVLRFIANIITKGAGNAKRKRFKLKKRSFNFS